MNNVADIKKVTFVKNASGNYVLSDEIAAYIDNQIELAIDREMYFLPDDENGVGKAAPDSPDNKTNETLTCAIKLKNRIGVYAVGRKAALDKLRPMFQFQLAEKLYREKQEAGDGLMTLRVNPEVLHQAENAEALKINLDAASVPTKNERGEEYSLWGRVQVFAGANTNEPVLSSLGSGISDDMVSRFLSWKLPQDFAPDCYIKFDKVDQVYADRCAWPTGTNLFTAEQAKQMLQHVIGVK